MMPLTSKFEDYPSLVRACQKSGSHQNEVSGN